jgi:hypothetical protein
MSRYDVLAKRTSPQSAPAETRAGQTTASRRGNPAYRQFSAYIPTDLYRRLKVRLAERDLDLSQAVEQAITAWIEKESGTQ